MALAIMRSHFAHSVSWAILWAILWRQQTASPRDHNEPAAISIDDLIGHTGFSRASVFRGLAELQKRHMVFSALGGGRGQKSLYSLEDLDKWLV